MYHAHGCSAFADGRSHPLDASSTDVAYSEYSWEAAFEHQGRTGERPSRMLIRFDSQWQVASGEDESLIIKSATALPPVGVCRGSGHSQDVAGRSRSPLSSLLVSPTHLC